jgi:hypothetical protein
MNCFGPKRFPILARYVDGKAGYATFKVKDAVTKKSPSTTVTFYFQRKQMAFNLISFCNMPLFT